MCGELYSYKSSTGNLKAHLRKKHLDIYQRVASNQASSEHVQQPSHHYQSIPISLQQPQQSVLPPQQSVPPPRTNIQQNIERYGTPKKISATLKQKIDRDLMDLFIDSYQPFSLVEERAFKKFCRWIPGYELPSRRTISQKMLPALYEATKEITNQELNNCNLLKICLTVDLWTSRANESYLSVTGHYITDAFELKSILIKCSNFEGNHTGENIQTALLGITNEFGLSTKVNFVVTDNAANMQRALNDIQWKHYGCYAHSLNLIVQNSLTIVEDNLSKLKKIVRHFKTSSTALDKLLKEQTRDDSQVVPKRLIQEVPTRWNSTYYMVARCVDLEQHLRATMAVLRVELPVISNEEWLLFAELTKILKPFEEVTKSMSGEKYMSGSSVIVMTRCLITSCHNLLQENFSEIAKLVIKSLNNGLESRFANVEKSATFSICTFLDPRYKMTVFTDQNDAKVAKKRVQDMLAASISNESVTRHHSQDLNVPGPSSQVPVNKFSPWSILTDIIGAQQPVGTPVSRAIKEIDTYLNDDILPVFDENGSFNCPIQWWRNHRFTYPNLARLHKQYGNIMATSVPCERVFSKTGLIISDRRTRLTSHKVSQLTFLNMNSDPDRFKL